MTKINLRKAANVQSSIKEHMNQLDLSTTVTVPLDVQAAKKAVNENQRRLETSLVVYNDLGNLLAKLRGHIAVANSKAGIMELLAKEAVLKEKIKQYQRLKNTKQRLADSVLDNQITKLNESRDGYYNNFETTIPIASEEFIVEVQNTLVNLKRELSEVNEQILQANISTFIEINDQDSTLLNRLGIV